MGRTRPSAESLAIQTTLPPGTRGFGGLGDTSSLPMDGGGGLTTADKLQTLDKAAKSSVEVNLIVGTMSFISVTGLEAGSTEHLHNATAENP
jgi:hypothetical protein